MKRQSYHHGDLSRALVREAVHTIQKDGVDALTLRAVGQKLGVSVRRCTAISPTSPRCWPLSRAKGSGPSVRGWRTPGKRTGPAERLRGEGAASFRFAVEHPSHYRVMLGGFSKVRSPTRNLRSRGPRRFRRLSMRSLRFRSRAVSGPAIHASWLNTSGRPCTVSRCSPSTACSGSP